MPQRKPKKPKIIAIIGPTSSGKTALSIALAKKIRGEVISVDSRQVYKGLNLGTGKVTKKEMVGVPHHLLDVVSPKHVFSVSEYVTLARAAIDDIISRGKIPILCGGTGLYLDATLGNVSIPEVPPNAALRKRLEKKTAAQLFAMLQKADPRRARGIDRHNPVRLVRALEIAHAVGKVPPLRKGEAPYDVLTIGLNPDAAILRKRIHTRLQARLKAGMLKEARRLHIKGLTFKRMEMLGLEYRYMALHLQKKISKKEMVEKLEQEINKYAKRQKQWFKRNRSIVWLKPGEIKATLKLVQTFLTAKK